MKKLKYVIIFTIMAALVVGYYVYLSNRTPQAKKKTSAATTELNDLLSLKVETNYPDTPREIVNLYCRIMKAYYKTELTEAQIEKLGTKSWLLFDSDLQNACISLDDFMVSLKDDIHSWNKDGRYVNEYIVESNSDIDYVTYGGGKQAAIVKVQIFVRQGSNLIPTTHEFYVGKNASGKWKILTWHLASNVSEEADNGNVE